MWGGACEPTPPFRTTFQTPPPTPIGSEKIKPENCSLDAMDNDKELLRRKPKTSLVQRTPYERLPVMAPAYSAARAARSSAAVPRKNTSRFQQLMQPTDENTKRLENDSYGTDSGSAPLNAEETTQRGSIKSDHQSIRSDEQPISPHPHWNDFEANNKSFHAPLPAKKRRVHYDLHYYEDGDHRTTVARILGYARARSSAAQLGSYASTEFKRGHFQLGPCNDVDG